ncbi:MAG: 50S ribosomal protein L20 [Bacilli bacterium]|nr:50S ribosomal protein L20 [Bacilli bacterium]
MTRVKGGTIHRARRKKVMKRAKGYFGSKHRLYKTAKEQVMHSLKYAYRDRRQKKRDFRKLWITRINAACRQNDISYSKFINGLSIAGVTINRKMLSEIAIDNPKSFTDLVEIAKSALNGNLKPEVKETKKATKETKTSKVEETKAEVKEDLSKMTVAELREIAKNKGINGVSTMKKAELLEALK